MCPALAGVSPEIARSVVVLPAPLAPISVTISPSSTWRLTPRNAECARRRRRCARLEQETHQADFRDTPR